MKGFGVPLYNNSLVHMVHDRPVGSAILDFIVAGTETLSRSCPINFSGTQSTSTVQRPDFRAIVVHDDIDPLYIAFGTAALSVPMRRCLAPTICRLPDADRCQLSAVAPRSTRCVNAPVDP